MYIDVTFVMRECVAGGLSIISIEHAHSLSSWRNQAENEQITSPFAV